MLESSFSPPLKSVTSGAWSGASQGPRHSGPDCPGKIIKGDLAVAEVAEGVGGTSGEAVPRLGARGGESLRNGAGVTDGGPYFLVAGTGLSGGSCYLGEGH